MTGVVDAEVVSHGGRCFLVAEVKSTIAIEAAECQQMEMLQLHQSGETVLGLLVNPARILPTSNRLQFTCITRNLNSVVAHLAAFVSGIATPAFFDIM